MDLKKIIILPKRQKISVYDWLYIWEKVELPNYPK